jgi:hypothetical protein
MSPPKKVGPDVNDARANRTTNNHHEVGYQQDSRFDDLAARGRRRRHAIRSAPISRCGCIRDPEVDFHRRGNTDVITDVLASAAVSAAEHLRRLGVPGLFDAETCRAMWRQGEHQLAAESFRFSHGEAA